VSTPFGHLWTRRTAFLGIAVTIALSVAAVWFRRVQPQPVCCPGAGPAALNEPIAGHGPFVMNTYEEIQQAFADYHHGRLGKAAA